MAALFARLKHLSVHTCNRHRLRWPDSFFYTQCSVFDVPVLFSLMHLWRPEKIAFAYLNCKTTAAAAATSLPAKTARGSEIAQEMFVEMSICRIVASISLNPVRRNRLRPV